jgi:MFS family permease
MYQAESARLLVQGRAEARPQARLRVSRNVVLLGLTSLLTDVSAEMVATVLPIYAVFALGASPLQYGLLDGLYQGAAGIVRIASGVVADRRSRYKELAAFGYGISAACKGALLAVGGSIGGLSAIILADRLGKGVRTAPRDALISLSSTREGLATAFGVHRAMDTAGAMLGPIVAFGILLAAPGAFDAVFAVSLCFAILGLAVLVLFVRNRREREPAAAPRRASLKRAASLVVLPRFRLLLVVSAGLGLVTVSDAFLYLGLQRRLDFDTTVFPLLFAGSACAYMLLAIPIGWLADRLGRMRVFVAGYVLLLLVYTALLVPSVGAAGLALYLLLLGGYYACTDGVLMATASALVPEDLRASGLAVLVTATSLAKLLAAVLFGLLWTVAGLATATIAFGAALALVTAVAALAFRREDWRLAGA